MKRNDETFERLVEQLDVCLVDNNWRDVIVDVRSHREVILNS